MKSARWHQERRTGLGGSDMPSVLGICPFGGSPLGVWRAKVGITTDNKEDNPDIQRGNFLEPIIRDLYRKETGFIVTHCPDDIAIRHPSERWAMAHLDGDVIDDTADGPGVLEIKAPRRDVFIRLEEYGVPANYQVQIQHYLFVTGRKWADFVAWNADCFRLLMVRVARDDDLIALIVERGRDFWNRFVLTGIPPDENAAPVVKIKNLSPTVKVLDSPEWRAAAAQWVEAKAILDDAQELVARRRENLIKLASMESYSKIRGAGVSLCFNKNGIASVRHGKQEITT